MPLRRTAIAFVLPCLSLLAQQDQAPPASLPEELKQVVSGYAAKVAASALFTSQRTLESVLEEEMAPDAPLQALVRPFLQYTVDRERKRVTATVLGTSATAVFVEGMGCTLLHGDESAVLARARTAPTPPVDPRPWPLGDSIGDTPLPDGVDGKALDAALRYAFADRDGRTKARTRAVVVVHKGRLLAERYAPGYGPQTVLPGWSMTKSLVNALVGLRVQDGALDPNAPLPVPEWQTPGDPRQALRLLDLLRMESGLQWTEDYDQPGSHALRMLFLESDFGGLAARQPLEHEPRTTHRYSSGTTNLLCRVLRATFPDDRSYLAYAKERLFVPLGMSSALIEPDASGVLVGSSYGFATARDWARFGQFYLQGGAWNGQQVLSADWVAQARTPCASSPRGDYGAHVWLNAGNPADPKKRPFDKLPRDLFYLSGFEGQYVVGFPSADLVVVRLGCTKRGGFDLHGFLQKVLTACGGTLAED